MGFINSLKKLFGERASTDDEVLKIYWRDYWPLAVMREALGQEIILPIAVVWPEDTEEVIEVVKLANKHGFKIVPYGGGSGVTGAAIGSGAVVMDLRRMNNILSIDEDDLTVTVEAGLYLKDLEEKLNEMGYTIRHIPQSYPEAVIGGLISTFSIGQYSTKYGGIEDMVLNLEVVTPYGEVTWLRRNIVPRSAAGPDLKKLFIGAEGQLGIVTKAVLKIRPLPNHTWMNTYIFRDFIEANYAVRELIKNGIVPAVIRIYDKEDSNVRFNVDGNIMLIIIEEYIEEIHDVMVDAASKILSTQGGSEAGETYVRKWLDNRFDIISEITKFLLPMNLWFDTIETITTWSKLDRLYRTFKSEVSSVEGTLPVLAHSSHFYLNGACIYFTMIFERKEDVYWRLWNKAMKVLLENGGSISHHHGIGRLRSKWIEEELLGGYDIIKRIKSVMDPNNIMGSGWL